MTARDRRILHVDMDAFYVGVEARRRPELAGRPVIVGGTGPRGVVASASYEARACGVTSAQPMSIARRRCPEAVVLPGDMAAYQSASDEVMAIVADITPVWEPLSLDEAFLDVSGVWRRHGSATAVAHLLRSRIEVETNLSCCVGVAATKFLAKMASGDAKPRPTPSGPAPGAGVLVIAPGREREYLDPLPVRKLWGVGPVTAERLGRLGVQLISDIEKVPEASLAAAIGAGVAAHVRALARGEDDRPVECDRSPKSIGQEVTFPVDLTDPHEVAGVIRSLSDAVSERLAAAELSGRTISIKVRFGDFRTVTRSATSDAPTCSSVVIARRAEALLAQLEPTEILSHGVRLAGVTVSGFAENPGEQLAFDMSRPTTADTGAADRVWDDVDPVVHAIRDRFGRGSIRPGPPGDDMAPDRPAWGPDSDGPVFSKDRRP